MQRAKTTSFAIQKSLQNIYLFTFLFNSLMPNYKKSTRKMYKQKYENTDHRANKHYNLILMNISSVIICEVIPVCNTFNACVSLLMETVRKNVAFSSSM